MPTPISTPSGTAPAYAVGFADPQQNLILVSGAEPLPVSGVPNAPAPLAGETSASMLAGPFEAVAGRIVSVVLEGTFEGTATLLRSLDGGATRDALRVAGMPWGVYTAPGCEQAWLESEDGAEFYLDIALVSGSMTYRVSQ